jgi:drug/metabolite transporter (DMT)-like permease
MKLFLLMFSSVFLCSAAQMLVKKGMTILGIYSFSFSHMLNLFIAIFTNIYLFLGMFCYGISVLLWMIVLSRVPVSVAYPFSSVGFIITMIFSSFLLNEMITFNKVMGIGFICLGVYLIFSTH